MLDVGHRWTIAGASDRRGIDRHHYYAPGPSEWVFRNISTAEIADSVVLITLADSRNVTVGESAFARFPNFNFLKIFGPSVGEGERAPLHLAPGVFQQSSRLEHLGISRMAISDESMRELLGLKDRLITIGVTDVSPEDKMFTALAQFTNLTYMAFNNCTTRSFPMDVVKSSAAVLQTFEIENCYFPKLARNQFAGLPKLNRLLLKETNLSEVEAGAFDQNLELRKVDLRDNDLASLPDGLFSKLKEISSVELLGNPRLIGSIDRSNFTHGQKTLGGFYFNLS